METTIIQLYQRGVTTCQIAELIEQMYGHCYTPATISTIAANVSDQVEQFHKRPVAKRYAVIFCDAMYVNLRRDSVAKESIHVLLGITPEGHKEIFDYAILPSESALNYADMLKSLKTRGLEQVLLFVSDGLVGLFSMNSRNTWTEKQAFSLDSHYSLVPSTGHRLLAGTPTTIVYASRLLSHQSCGYSASVTGSHHSLLVSVPGISNARCENQLCCLAPCQCLTPAGISTMSPGARLCGTLPSS